LYLVFYKAEIVLHTSLNLNLGVVTVETIRDRDRDCPQHQEQLLKVVEIIHQDKTKSFNFLVEIFKIEICIKIM
jgi:hypothetical protein